MQTQNKPIVKNEYDQILEFVRAVVPNNWNVYWGWTRKELKKDRHTCNIQLQDDPYRDILEDDPLVMPHNLLWLDGIMFAKIYLDTYRFYAIEETILHELAHVAEHRYIMLKDRISSYEKTSLHGSFFHYSDGKNNTKAHRVLPFTDKFEDHGELFERFLNTFHSRARKKGTTLDLAKLFALPR